MKRNILPIMATTLQALQGCVEDRVSVIYVDEICDGNPLHQISLRQAPTRAHEVIRSLIAQHKTFFADNEIGEIFANWAQNKQGIAREAI